MKWNFKGIISAAGLLVLVSAIRLQDKFIYQNEGERKAEVKSADQK